MMMECQSCPTWFVVCHITLLIEFKSDGGFCMLLYRSLVCLVSPPCAICWCDSRALIWLSFICWCSWWRRRQGAVLCHVTRSYQTKNDHSRRYSSVTLLDNCNAISAICIVDQVLVQSWPAALNALDASSMRFSLTCIPDCRHTKRESCSIDKYKIKTVVGSWFCTGYG